jgi:hypothetical protein
MAMGIKVGIKSHMKKDTEYDLLSKAFLSLFFSFSFHYLIFKTYAFAAT